MNPRDTWVKPFLQKIVVLPSRGIGDALLMMIASEHFLRKGFDVTTVHPKLPELKEWFPDHKLAASWNFSKNEWIVVQNDNSEKIRLLKDCYRDRLSILYPTYSYRKHGPLSRFDRVFDSSKSMAQNIAIAIASLLKCSSISKENGLRIPPSLTHRLNKERVLIHHTSSSQKKNWLDEKYKEVSKGLERRGFEPVFIHPFDSLHHLASFVYESGFVIGNDSLVGHLASNLHIPTLIIADNHERMHLWRPGWLEGSIVTLSKKIPKWKFFQNNWQYFISSRRVLRTFDNIAL